VEPGQNQRPKCALWYNGQFGEDNLYLLRPFSADGQESCRDDSLSLQAGDAKFTGKDRPADSGAHGTGAGRLLKSLELMQSNLLKDKRSRGRRAHLPYPAPVHHQMKRITTTAASLLLRL
jgi:hypothetical protein